MNMGAGSSSSVVTDAKRSSLESPKNIIKIDCPDRITRFHALGFY
jgi:hypothetical protein